MVKNTFKKTHRSHYVSLLLTILAIIYMITSPSCANQGVGPEGGLKDTIPPKISSLNPVIGQTNFNSNQIEVTFNEFITLDNINQKLVVSPPVAEKPTIKTKGKSVFVKFNEDLVPERTYSVDFQNSIKDYNEGNKLESLRMLFSTYDKIDTLRIGGFLLDAFTLEPIENALATLYTIDDDSMFSTMRPDYIARANEKGYFLFDNLAEGKYRLFGLVETDNNLKYSNDLEQIAFYDSLISPSKIFIDKIDTLFNGKDTIISKGYFEYLPKEVYPRLFQVQNYAQFLNSNKRTERDYMQFIFSESLNDSFKVDLLKYDSISDWNYIEFSPKRDTVSLWITAPMVYNNDSLYFCLQYSVLDSTNQFITMSDTLKMFYSNSKEVKKKATSKETATVEPFQFTSNASPNNFDYYLPVYLEAPRPVSLLAKESVNLVELIDTVEVPVPFELKLMENSKRKYLIDFKLKENTQYQITVDSAAVKTLNNNPNDLFELNIKTQKADFYGSFIVEINGITSKSVLQLLKDSKEEVVEKEIQLKEGEHTVKIEFLKPTKYKLKLIADTNENGKWDTGDYKSQTQPERVYYFPKAINIRSNWELKENWNIDPLAPLQKVVEESAKKEKE